MTFTPCLQASACHDTTECIMTRSPSSPTALCCNTIPPAHFTRPDCYVTIQFPLYHDPILQPLHAPATIQSLYHDVAFPPGQANLLASVSRYNWLYRDPVPMPKIGSSPANSALFLLFFTHYFFFFIFATGNTQKQYIHFFFVLILQYSQINLYKFIFFIFFSSVLPTVKT